MTSLGAADNRILAGRGSRLEETAIFEHVSGVWNVEFSLVGDAVRWIAGAM